MGKRLDIIWEVVQNVLLSLLPIPIIQVIFQTAAAMPNQVASEVAVTSSWFVVIYLFISIPFVAGRTYFNIVEIRKRHYYSREEGLALYKQLKENY